MGIRISRSPWSTISEDKTKNLYITDPKTNKVCKTDLKGNILITIMPLAKSLIMKLPTSSNPQRQLLHLMVTYTLPMATAKILLFNTILKVITFVILVVGARVMTNSIVLMASLLTTVTLPIKVC